MKIIDRYISAYAVMCLIGYPESIHTEYLYQVLRESKSVSRHPALQAVLDIVRQGDPKSPKTKQTVRQWMMERIAGAGGYKAEAPVIPGGPLSKFATSQETPPKYEAYIHVQHEIATVSVFNATKNEIEAFVVATKHELPEIRKLVQEKFPNVEFHE